MIYDSISPLAPVSSFSTPLFSAAIVRENATFRRAAVSSLKGKTHDISLDLGLQMIITSDPLAGGSKKSNIHKLSIYEEKVSVQFKESVYP